MDNSEKGEYLFERYPKATLILTAFFGCLLVAVLIELVVRSVSNEWTPKREECTVFWRYDPVLGWSHRPGQRGGLHHKDFGIEIAINS
jgi:hypothetical protein